MERVITQKVPEIHSPGLLGEVKSYVKDPVGYLQNRMQEYGNIYRFRVAYRHLVFVNEPAYIERILQANHRNYKKSLAYRKLELLLGKGLFTSEGDFWRQQRRMMQPAFHQKEIEGYFEIFARHTDKFVQEAIHKRKIGLASGMTRLTLSIISEALLGIKIGDEGNVVEEYLPFALKFILNRITSTLNAPMWFPTEDNQKFKEAKRILDETIIKLINQKKQGDLGSDLLSQLIKIQQEEGEDILSDTQLKDEILTFFLAGHETTAITAFWTIYLLEQHPEIKIKLLKELSLLDTFSLESIGKCAYLDAAIKESMRLVSPVWIISREATGDDQFGPYSIKKGDNIIFSPYLIQRDKRFWKDPTLFDPNRFIEGESEQQKFTYFPFGGGPRLCIGKSFAMLELKVILAKILQEVEIKMPGEFPGYDFSLTLRPKTDVEVEVSPSLNR